MGLEPTTSAVTGRRSHQLSHRAKEGDIPSKLHIQLTSILFRVNHLPAFSFPSLFSVSADTQVKPSTD